MADGWDQFQAAPKDSWEQFAPAKAAAAAPVQATGPQPSTMQNIAASPVGRLIHNVVVQPLEGAAQAASSVPLLSGLGAIPKYVTPKIEGAYHDAIAAQQNRPGYAAARASEDAQRKAMGSGGLTDQFIAPFAPVLAGVAGMGGGMKSMMAAADSQQASQDAYSKQHPILSTGMQVLGGLAASPKLPQVSAPGVPVSTLRPMAQEASDAGYVLPPRMISSKPGMVADTAAAWSGKVKTAQAASAKNQEVTNVLANTALGLPKDAVLTDKVFENLRSAAGKAYGAIPKALPRVSTDQQFVSTVQGLGAKSSAAASEFPELLENPEIDKLVNSLSTKADFSTDAGISLVRKLRKDANSNFKAAGDVQKMDLAFAQRHAADALDDLIERNLALSGNAQLANEYKAARQLIAKSHDVEAATNTATGNVSARKIAALANRGRPLSGELDTIANTANAFPKAMQSEAAFGEVEPLSVLDIAAATAAAPHNPSLLAAVLGRPLVRSAILSKPVQRGITAAAAKPRTLAAPFGIPQLTNRSAVPFGLLDQALVPRSQQP